MLNKVKRYIPGTAKKALKRERYILKKELEYVEVHLTDHCNLNCKGCTHYSTLAPPRYTDVRQYQLDMLRLTQLFRHIRKVRLLGGEPLLHPDPVSFITTTRAAFPRTEIRFVTNGILLPKASQDFWDACRNTDTIIDVTVYPPLSNRVADLRSLCDSKGVRFEATSVMQTFEAHLNLKGDSDRKRSFHLCRDKHFIPLLRDGRLHTCPMSALAHYFNKQFGYQIHNDEGVNIHSSAASVRAILRKLSRPTDSCKWCSYDYIPFAWSTSGLNGMMPEDWDAASQPLSMP